MSVVEVVGCRIRPLPRQVISRPLRPGPGDVSVPGGGDPVWVVQSASLGSSPVTRQSNVRVGNTTSNSASLMHTLL